MGPQPTLKCFSPAFLLYLLASLQKTPVVYTFPGSPFPILTDLWGLPCSLFSIHVPVAGANPTPHLQVWACETGLANLPIPFTFLKGTVQRRGWA